MHRPDRNKNSGLGETRAVQDRLRMTVRNWNCAMSRSTSTTRPVDVGSIDLLAALALVPFQGVL